MNRNHWHRRISAFFFLGLLLISGSAAAQQEGDPDQAGQPNERGIAMQVRAGFDGFHKGEGWLPVQITIANSGAPVEGTIEVFSRSENINYQLPVSLPTQSNKRLNLPVYINDFTNVVSITLRDESGTTIAVSRSNPIKSISAEDGLLYGVIGPRPDSLEILEKVLGGRTEAGVAFITLAELPLNQVVWQDLDVLVLNDIDSNQLSAGQREALESWLRRGGQLVVTGGAGWQKTTAAVSDWLPVTITRSESVTDLAALEAAAGAPFRDPGPYVIANSTLRDGELIFHQDGLPLLARRPLGRGAVYFLALDPQFAPLDDWDGSLSLWDEIAAAAPRQAVWENGFINENMAADAAGTFPALFLPSAFLLFCFVGLYVILIGPANYIILGRTKRRELAWLTIPLTIVVFSLVAYLLGLQFKGNTVVINQMALVSGRIGEPNGEVNAAVAVYSPRRKSIDIRFKDDVLVSKLTTFSSGGALDDLDVEQGADTVLRDTLIDVGGVATFDARQVLPLPEVQGMVELVTNNNAQEIEVTVTNNGPNPIEHAILLFDGRSSDIGTIRPGETISRMERIDPRVAELMRETGRGGPIYFAEDSGSSALSTSSYVPSPLETYYSSLLGTSSFYGDREVYPRYQLLESLYDNYGGFPIYRPESVVILAGWIDEPQLDIGLEGERAESNGTSLIFLEIPFK